MKTPPPSIPHRLASVIGFWTLVLVAGLPACKKGFTTAPLGPPENGWPRTYGGAAIDEAHSIRPTSDGGYIVAGNTSSYGAGQSDLLLIKLSAHGTPSKMVAIGGPDYEYGREACQTPDGGYILVGWTYSFGAGQSDAYLVKTNANANYQWSRTFGGADYDRGYSVQPTADGGYVVTGYTTTAADAEDVFLIKTDADGNTAWVRTFGGPGTDRAYSVRQTTDGGYILAGDTQSLAPFGAFLIKTDADGNSTWSRAYGALTARSVLETPDGGFILAGTTDAGGHGGYDAYLLKTDSGGNFSWDGSYGGSGDEEGYSVCRTQDGGYGLLGETPSFGSGMEDFFLMKTDAGGVEAWSHPYGGSDSDSGRSVLATVDGGFLMAGVTRSFGAGDWDAYVVKTDAGGDLQR